jgi:hypothetical protein
LSTRKAVFLCKKAAKNEKMSGRERVFVRQYDEVRQKGRLLDKSTVLCRLYISRQKHRAKRKLLKIHAMKEVLKDVVIKRAKNRNNKIKEENKWIVNI